MLYCWNSHRIEHLGTEWVKLKILRRREKEDGGRDCCDGDVAILSEILASTESIKRHQSLSKTPSKINFTLYFGLLASRTENMCFFA